MVGVPLGVLLVMLEAGRSITGAAPVAGEWRVESAASPGKTGCRADEVFGAGSLTLVQMGQFLTARREGIPFDGRIDGRMVTLSGGTSALTARLSAATPVITMEGTVAGSAGDCDPVPFRARLVAPLVRPVTPGGRH